MDQGEEQKRKSFRERTKERIDSARSKYNNAKTAARAGKTAGRLTTQAGKAGGRVATQVGRQVATQGSRIAAQAGMQAARVAAQLAIQAAVAIAEALAEAVAAATAAVAAVAIPLGAIILGVVLIIIVIVAGFMFFFIGTPPTTAGQPPDNTPNVCVGLCKASCLASESDLGTNTVSCTDPAATHCCLPAGTLPPLHFYCQYGAVNSNGTLISPRSWNYPIGGGLTCSIEINGCVPTTIAMVLTSFGDTQTPTQVSQQSGDLGCFGPSAPDRSFIQSQGFTMTGGLVVGGNINLTTINNYLTHGYYILAAANVFPIHSNGVSDTRIGHAFVITAVNLATGSITVSDPTACEGGFSNGTRTFTNVNASGGDVNGWLYAYAVKKP